MLDTAVATGPQFETRTPDLLLSGGHLSVKMPVLNSGDSTAARMTLTNITLGTASRLEPALPYVLGDLGARNRVLVSAVFLAGSIAPGARLMLTARGTYRSGGQTLAFTLNRVVVVPAESPPPTDFLAARLEGAVDLAAHRWSYTIVNEEPAGSPRFVNAVSIDMVAPFTVTGTPDGWEADTDNATYVLWFSPDAALPYPHHVAPGSSLGGFQIESSGASASEGRTYSITSWNHSTDSGDNATFGTTLVPARS